MQPQSPHTKPVMDVAAPPRPASPVAPAVLAPSVAPVAVAPAPDTDKDAATKPASSLPPIDDTPEKTEPAPALTPSKQPKKPGLEGPHAPVALITVTIFVMLALSGIAVLIYLSSKS